MSSPVVRGAIAVAALVLLAVALARLDRRVPRDLGLAIYAVAAAAFGIFTFFGPEPAALGVAIVLAVAALGASIYGLLALASRWTQ